jgi:hypothetical protein
MLIFSSFKYDLKQRIVNMYKLVIIILTSSFVLGCGDNDKIGEVESIFTEITDDVKLDFIHDPAVDGTYYMPESIGSGGALLDFDNDGDLDIYLINGAARKVKQNQSPLMNKLFRQEKDGTFIDVTEISHLGDQGNGMGVAVGDINNDGYVDVYISNDGPDALYLNNGDGTYTDISKDSGIHNPDWGISVTFLDYNLDNFLDVFVTNYVKFDTSVICFDRVGKRDYCGPQGFPGYQDRLFRNNGDNTFTDVSVESGISTQPSAGLGVISADFNNDHYPDIYVSNDRKYNHLWINQKDGTFKDEALITGLAINGLGMAEASMGIALGDVDNDCDLDLFVTHFGGETNTFFLNAGNIGFKDETINASLATVSLPYTGFGTGFFDYDHDGDLDLAVVNGRVIRGPVLKKTKPVTYWDHYAEPNLLFKNDGYGRFNNVSDSAKDFTGRIENSRGLILGDVDNDGDLDLLVTNEGGRVRLYRNDKPKLGNWIIIKAVDPSINRDVYGAKIELFAGSKKYFRLINTGYSFCSSHDPRAHFGLGIADVIDKIIVTWPGGESDMFKDVSVNQFLRLEKGTGENVRGI